MKRAPVVLMMAIFLGSCSPKLEESRGVATEHMVIDSLLRRAIEQERSNAASSYETARRGLELASTVGTLAQRAQLSGSLLYHAMQLDSMALYASLEPGVLLLFDSLGDGAMLARHLRRMGDTHYRRTMHAPSLAYYDRSMEVARTAGATLELAETMSSLGSLLLETAAIDEALTMQRSALRILDSLGVDSLPRIRVMSNLGYAHYWAGQPDSAILNYSNAITALGKLDNEQMLAWNLLNRGSAYIEKGLYTPALEDLHRAHDLHVSAGRMFEAAACTYYLAYCHEHVSPPDTVITAYQQAIAIYDSLKVPQRSMTVHGQLGRYLVDLDSTRCAASGLTIEQRNELALAHCRQGVAVCRTFNIPVQLGDLLDGLCDAERATGELDSALTHAQEALRIRSTLDSPSRTAGSYKDLGMVLQALGQMKEAEQAYLKGLELLHDHPHVQNEMTLHDGLRSLYADMGRFEKAYEHAQHVQRIQSNTFSEKQRQELVQRDLQWKFDHDRLTDSIRTAQRVHDIDTLRTIAELRAARADTRVLWIGITGLLFVTAGIGLVFLDRHRRHERFAKEAAQLEAKALRAQMDPHFIGNTLHAVNGYLLSNDAPTASTLLSHFARWIRSTLESSRHEEIPLHADLEAMRTYLTLEQARTGNKFTFLIDVPDDEELLRVHIPPMLVQPFLENAIQHGVLRAERPGHIVLSIADQGDHLRITVEDNGAGRGQTHAPATLKGKTSISTTITRERLGSLGARTGRPAGVKLTDLERGTRVELLVPVV